MGSLSAPLALLYGTLTVAVLDGLYVVTIFAVRGVPPGRVFQGVAAGLLGREAFQGGVTTAVLGILLHFFIAFVVVTTYFVVSRRVTMLRQRVALYGPLYGVFVYAFMNLVVLPLSAAGGGRTTWPFVLGGLAIHAFGVGLPAAAFAAAHHRSLRQRLDPPPPTSSFDLI
jgi:hypothetical protein